MKFLVAGLNVCPNNITRAIDSYEGCTWVHQDGDQGANIPGNIDAVIVVTSHCSHGKMWEIKDEMKRQGKPCWLINQGFSEVTERFETFLRDKGHTVIRKGQSGQATTALGAALNAALTPPVEDNKPIKSKTPTLLNVEGIFNKSLEAEKQGITNPRDITKWLEANNYRSSTGVVITKQRLYAIQSQFRKKYGIKVAPGRSRPSPVQASDDQPISALSNAPKISNARMIELIGKVTSSNLPPEKKNSLIEEILVGVRTVEHQVIAERKGDHLQITMQSIFHEADKPLVLIDKITAVGILKVLPEIREFVGDE